MPATKAIRISQSFNDSEINEFAEICRAAQRGAVPHISDTKAFQSLASKAVRMSQRVKAKKTAAADAG